MRVLLTIPHYCHSEGSPLFGSLSEARIVRAAALRQCVLAWRATLGLNQAWAHLDRPAIEPANLLTRVEMTIIVCTTAGRHALKDLGLSRGTFRHAPVECPPLELGFACHGILRQELGNYDYYCYSEDDLVLHDAWLFAKLRSFIGAAGPECLLQPNRYELASDGSGTKLYIDGDVDAGRTAPHQDICDRPELLLDHLGEPLPLRRTGNPHSGCFFLTAAQMAHWSRQPYFLDGDRSFYSPLESAATLGIMRTFRIYKPAPAVANFLEIQHCGDAWIKKIGLRNARVAREAQRPR